MEASLMLYRHHPGDLVKHWKYFHDRTGGTLAALSDLIREAADEAIESGAEAITKAIMDDIVLSQRAEANYARKRSNSKAAKTSATPTIDSHLAVS